MSAARLKRCVFGVFFAVILICCSAARAGELVPGPPPPPPLEYYRNIEIRVQGLDGAPIPGVELKMKPRWGRRIDGDLESEQDGMIRFTMQPAIEDVHEDKRVSDRLLLYITDFDYELLKPGYMPKTGRFHDETDFASFSHPLYKGMSRSPDPNPVERKFTLYRAEDFLAGTGGEAGLRAAVEAVYAEADDYNITPWSTGMDSEGFLRAGLEFKPLFNPAEYGLQGAGAALLREPIRHFLSKIWMNYGGFGGLAGFEITVLASFQYPSAPFALPVEQTFVYRLTPSAAQRLLDWPGNGSFPLDGIQVTAEFEPLDLTPELDPDKIRQAPGALLSTTE